jgi:nucleoside-diphosphate-sugar epimerase
MMVCVVTGGAGFISSHLVDSLVARGWIGDVQKLQLSLAKLKDLGWSPAGVHRKVSGKRLWQ